MIVLLVARRRAHQRETDCSPAASVGAKWPPSTHQDADLPTGSRGHLGGRSASTPRQPQPPSWKPERAFGCTSAHIYSPALLPGGSNSAAQGRSLFALEKAYGKHDTGNMIERKIIVLRHSRKPTLIPRDGENLIKHSSTGGRRERPFFLCVCLAASRPVRRSVAFAYRLRFTESP